MGLVFLVIMLATIVANGTRAFTQTFVSLEVTLDAEEIAAAEVRLKNLSAQEAASAARLASLEAEIKGRGNVLDELNAADAQLADEVISSL